MVELTVDEDELVQRVVRRAEQENRPDDTPDVIRTRLAVYNEQTAPLIPYYEAKGIVREVNGMGTMDEVAAAISRVLDKG